AELTDAQWVNAVRRGLRSDGTSLMIMPAEAFQYFSDEDLGAVIAYVKSVAPVDTMFPKGYLGPLGRALYLAGKLPVLVAEAVDHSRRQPVHVDAGATPEYGRYQANVGGCTGCHGPGLSGGSFPGGPPDAKPAANLTPTGLAQYAEADFFRALREG